MPTKELHLPHDPTNTSLDYQLQCLINLPEAARNRALELIEKNNPQAHKELTYYLKTNKGFLLEARGPEHWLKSLGPQTFTRPFAPIQKRFIEWNWNALLKIRNSQPLAPRETVGFLPWPRETGKCVASGTEILRIDGTRSPIEDITAGDLLLSIDQATGHCVPDRVKAVLASGEKQCLRIRFRSGKSLILTPEHRLWTVDGWRAAGALVEGDRVAAPRRTRPKETAQHSDAEVKLVAYMIAEGSTVPALARWVTKDGQVKRSQGIGCHATFTNADRVVVTDFKVAAAGMGFGVNQIRHQGRQCITYSLIKARQWLRDVGLAGKGAHEKRVPEWVFSLPERQRWLFLAALVDTDGYVTDSDGVSIALANKELVEDICYLFTSVGVPSKVFFKPNECRGAWVLNASKGATGLCAAKMPLILKRDRLLKFAETQKDSLLDAYPVSVVLALPSGVNRMIRNAGGPRFGGTYPIVTRSKIRRAIDFRALPRWVWLEQADVMWDEIYEITDGGVHSTYDIQMSNSSENFIANGIVSHNSSIVEWACIMEGALLKSGYVIYLSSKLSQAIDHVVAIRDRIESEHVAEVYPWMGKPKLGQHGNKFGWGQEFLMTSGGWAIRPVGADVAMRGGKSINIRPTLIVPDDYDELGDSPHVVEHKEHMLTRAILPMGNANTRVLVPQNPIHENSVVNRMLTGVSLALAIKTVFGEINDDGSLSNRPIPAVNGLVYEVRQADEGPYSVITQGTSNWDGITEADWETTLNRVGPEAFKAEYQHDLSTATEERVLPEYDDRVLRIHLITWSQYEAKYGHRRIPSDWGADVGCDIGYSSGHRTAFTFLATAPQGAPLAGSVFRYRGCVFTATTIGDMSVAVKARMWPSEEPQREWLSHEKLGERLVLNREHGWHFQTCDSGKTAGIPQWRHFLRPDRSQPHPFHRDEKGVNGLWKLGRPAWFDIVEDDQFIAPHDDKGLKVHRDQAFNWRLKPEKLTESGITIQQPMKANEDSCDATRMCTSASGFAPLMRPMTEQEKLIALVPKGYSPREMADRNITANQAAMTSELIGILAKKASGQRSKLLDEFGQELR